MTDSFFMEIPDYYDHQKETLEFIRGRVDAGEGRVFDASDAGTGKTRPAIGAFVERRKQGGGKALVLAPKSILQPAWGDDIGKFFPGTSFVCAYASNRAKAFEYNVDMYITNHDAVTWMLKNLPASYWDDFDTLIVDESTAYKNHTAKRSKATQRLGQNFEFRELMSATFNPNGVCDVWHQALILDDGESLGTSYYKFRSIVCEPQQVGPSVQHIKWVDKPGAEEAVFDMMDHMMIRHRYEDCHDSDFGEPYKVFYELQPPARKRYAEMEDLAVTMLADGELLTATQASAVHQKLMQIASGAVYTEEGKWSAIDDGRCELVMDLIEAREQCVVGFMWAHQRDQLAKAATKRGFTFGIIDGDQRDENKRNQIVKDFQAGKLRVLFAHPQSAGHGLTLTAGTTTIWTSPTYNSEHYIQFNARINRAGQDKRTETILVCAKDTVDETVYDKLGGKVDSMQLLLTLLEDN